MSDDVKKREEDDLAAERAEEAQERVTPPPGAQAAQHPGEPTSQPGHGATPPVDVANPPAPPPYVSGAQVILTGDAKAAARGDLHGTIVDNAAARDAAIAHGHVDPDTSPGAVADTLAASVGSSPDTLDAKAAADLRTAQQKEISDRAKAGGEALKR